MRPCGHLLDWGYRRVYNDAMTNEKKPWEQEWRTDDDGYMPSVYTDASDYTGGVIAEVVVRQKTAKSAGDIRDSRLNAARFIAAAPDMVRALLEVASEDESLSVDGVPCWCTRHGRERMRDTGIIRHEGFCDRARAALRKAGVLP